MNIYQKIKDLQAEIAELTGLKPNVQLSFHSHSMLTDEECERIRNDFLEDSGGELKQKDLVLNYGPEEEQWDFTADNDSERINISVFGPRRTKAEVEDVTA